MLPCILNMMSGSPATIQGEVAAAVIMNMHVSFYVLHRAVYPGELHYSHWDRYFPHPNPDIGGFPDKVKEISQEMVK